MDVPWLVTNTKFSSDVIRYGNCVGMHLIGWKYPEDGGLEKLIDEANIYPHNGIGHPPLGAAHPARP